MARDSYRLAAVEAWDKRWSALAWDMNGDGVTTISDAWLWIKWVIWLPGDFMLYATMDGFPRVAQFFEVEPDSFYGVASFLISLIVWMMLLLAISGKMKDL